MFEILRPNGADGTRWQSFIDSLPYHLRDIHHTPAYARVQECLGEVYAAIGQYDDVFVLQPFMLRQDDHADIVSLYGAGGPVSNATAAWTDFDLEFAEWRLKYDILCEYTQLSPLINEHQRQLIGGAVEITHTKDVVVVSLSCTDEELIKRFSRNRQRGVKSAQDRGVRVVLSKETQEFAKLYRQSMERLGAAAHWFYPDEIWDAYLQLGPENVSLFKSVSPWGVEGMLLVMHAYGKSYAHFLGTNTNASNDLLYYESMKHCRDAGASVYQLGGGLGREADPLMAYKAGFSKLFVPVHVYKRIFDEASYAAACEGLPQTNFFPAYRSTNADSAPVRAE